MKNEITRRGLILKVYRSDTLPTHVTDGFNNYTIISSYRRPYYGDLNRLYYDKENNEYLKLSDMAFLYETLKIDNIILDDEEKEYLSNIIKPFRSRVKYITKSEYNFKGYEYIIICVNDLPDNLDIFLYLPNFKTNTMYKNMKLNLKYTLNNLNL